MRSIALRPGIMAVVWLLSSAAVALAQDEEPATPASRDAQFAELARDVAHLEQEGSILKRVVRLVRPSVVHIDANRDAESTRTGLASGIEEAGSGILIERAGKFYVITNRHVVKFSTLEGIVVKLADGRLLRPTQIWSDHATDLAILAIPGRDLVAARIGDASKIDIGDFVLAVGSPFGLSHSVTYGIISAKGRRDLQLGDDGVVYQDFLQTDAAINPGNSGGPLLNLRGEVIGLNTAIASASGGNEGIGFAIPINMVMLVAEQLIDTGIVSRAFLGVRLDAAFGPEAALRAGLARPQGARVSGVTKGSPAEAASLRVGDVILSFGGTRVEDDNHLINLVSQTPVDREIDVRILRDGTIQTIQVKVANRTPGASP